MNQVTARDKDGNHILFGLDHAIGWFFDLRSKADPDVPLVEESSLFTDMDRGRFLDLINLHVHTTRQEALADIKEDIAMDLDPGNHRL